MWLPGTVCLSRFNAQVGRMEACTRVLSRMSIVDAMLPGWGRMACPSPRLGPRVAACCANRTRAGWGMEGRFMAHLGDYSLERRVTRIGDSVSQLFALRCS